MANPPKPARQLELPVMTSLPSKQTPLSHTTAKAAAAQGVRNGVVRTEASSQDLSIYRSISDNYFRKAK